MAPRPVTVGSQPWRPLQLFEAFLNPIFREIQHALSTIVFTYESDSECGL